MNPQSWNGYSYAAGNPMVNVDPSGQSFLSVLGNIFSFGLNVLFGGGGVDHGGGINTTQVIIGAIGTGIEIGTHAGGSSASSGAPASTPPSAPPVSSFPGESLGIPSGLSLPGPFGLGSYDPFIINGVLPVSAAVGSQFDSNIAGLVRDFIGGIHIWLNGRPSKASLSANTGGAGTSTRLFGTRYCGLGGDGTPINPLDQACRAHDSCYDKNRLSAFSNFNYGLTSGQKSDLQTCNQQLCDSSRSVFTKSSGGKYVNFYFSQITPVGGCK